MEYDKKKIKYLLIYYYHFFFTIFKFINKFFFKCLLIYRFSCLAFAFDGSISGTSPAAFLLASRIIEP